MEHSVTLRSITKAAIWMQSPRPAAITTIYLAANWSLVLSNNHPVQVAGVWLLRLLTGSHVSHGRHRLGVAGL
jgi:hypothetical protein